MSKSWSVSLIFLFSMMIGGVYVHARDIDLSDINYSISPYYDNKFLDKIERERLSPSYAKGQVVNFSSEDLETCLSVQAWIQKQHARPATSKDKEFCRSLKPGSMVSVTLLRPSNELEFQNEIDVSGFKDTSPGLSQDTRNLTFTMMAGMGALWLMPESVSKWDKENIATNGPLQKYKENVSSGPVMDKDDAVINFVGHPVSGAAYYMVARTNGLSPIKSFGYSAMLSTFFWEYGFEAMAERPSIQDLILTPTIGALVGEVAFWAYKKTEANDGKIAGSKTLGSVALVILNPVGALSSGINKMLDTKVIQDARMEMVTISPISSELQHTYPYVGVKMIFPINN